MLRCMHLEASINTTTVGFKKEECFQNTLKEFTGNFDFFFFFPIHCSAATRNGSSVQQWDIICFQEGYPIGGHGITHILNI